MFIQLCDYVNAYVWCHSKRYSTILNIFMVTNQRKPYYTCMNKHSHRDYLSTVRWIWVTLSIMWLSHSQTICIKFCWKCQHLSEETIQMMKKCYPTSESQMKFCYQNLKIGSLTVQEFHSKRYPPICNILSAQTSDSSNPKIQS